MQSGLGAIALLCVLWCATHLFGWSVELDGSGRGLRACLVDAAHARAVACLTRTCAAWTPHAGLPFAGASSPPAAAPLCLTRPAA
ncbi:hypothetical protein [Coralloluteibacterium stylophorae]|uniref:Uncharacterized protein n=1 Tax=Coralloluteibacterium stylophorae TaxID=1776034 RepID=A0A8J7VSE1_9GAMM|nr:hypothetical protein [Coralloluteibacterium stylophorae]MBS7457339.1 hypothetical protein [Coralloluteibacterium stylophorae]